MQLLLLGALYLSTPYICWAELSPARSLMSSSGDKLCPSYCECLREDTVDKGAAYSAECHVALNSLPMVCGKRWTSLKLNINNSSTVGSTTSSSTTTTTAATTTNSVYALFSYCHELTSLDLRQMSEIPTAFNFQAIMQGLRGLRRIWFHFVQIETDGITTANFYHLPAKIELIAFSDCPLKLDREKALFFNTPINLRQLRLTNVSLNGVFRRHLLINLCHTSTNAMRPNNLVSLYLDRNSLIGLSRDSLVGCSQLRVLQLSNNQLSGSLDQVMGVKLQDKSNKWTTENTQAALESTELGVLGFTPQLQALDLSSNSITCIRSPLWAYGADSAHFHSLTELKTISLANNNLSFIVRGAFQGAPNLREIDLSRNPKLFCPLHIETPLFYSYVDPYIFGGVEKLTKIYWDFSDKTCILSAMMSDSNFGVLSEGLFNLFSSRPLCLTPVDGEHMATPVTTLPSFENKQNKLLSTETMTASWSPMEITSSFLCGLIGLLLIALLIVLIMNSKAICEAVNDCCCGSPKDQCQLPLRMSGSPREEGENRPNTSPCYTLPRSRIILVTDDKETERLNNGAVVRSGSLQNLCLACLEQNPATYAHPLEFYDNYKNLTKGFVDSGRTQVKSTSGTEVTRVVLEPCQPTTSGCHQSDRKLTISERSYI